MGERLEAVLEYICDEVRREAERHGTAFSEIKDGNDIIYEIGDIEIILHDRRLRLKSLEGQRVPHRDKSGGA